MTAHAWALLKLSGRGSPATHAMDTPLSPVGSDSEDPCFASSEVGPVRAAYRRWRLNRGLLRFPTDRHSWACLVRELLSSLPTPHCDAEEDALDILLLQALQGRHTLHMELLKRRKEDVERHMADAEERHASMEAYLQHVDALEAKVEVAGTPPSSPPPQAATSSCRRCILPPPPTPPANTTAAAAAATPRPDAPPRPPRQGRRGRQRSFGVTREDTPLPPGWVCMTSRRASAGQRYYHHAESGVSTWSRP